MSSPNTASTKLKPPTIAERRAEWATATPDPQIESRLPAELMDLVVKHCVQEWQDWKLTSRDTPSTSTDTSANPTKPDRFDLVPLMSSCRVIKDGVNRQIYKEITINTIQSYNDFISGFNLAHWRFVKNITVATVDLGPTSSPRPQSWKRHARSERSRISGLGQKRARFRSAIEAIGKEEPKGSPGGVTVQLTSPSGRLEWDEEGLDGWRVYIPRLISIFPGCKVIVPQPPNFTGMAIDWYPGGDHHALTRFETTIHSAYPPQLPPASPASDPTGAASSMRPQLRESPQLEPCLKYDTVTYIVVTRHLASQTSIWEAYGEKQREKVEVLCGSTDVGQVVVEMEGHPHAFCWIGSEKEKARFSKVSLKCCKESCTKFKGEMSTIFNTMLRKPVAAAVQEEDEDSD